MGRSSAELLRLWAAPMALHHTHALLAQQTRPLDTHDAAESICMHVKCTFDSIMPLSSVYHAAGLCRWLAGMLSSAGPRHHRGAGLQRGPPAPMHGSPATPAAALLVVLAHTVAEAMLVQEQHAANH